MDKQPTRVDVDIRNDISIPEDQLPVEAIEKLKEQLIFTNPQWLENKKRGYWNGKTPEKLYFLKSHNNYLKMPRGFIHQLKSILEPFDLTLVINDQTRILDPVEFQFKGSLYDFQERAVRVILKRKFGVFNCPTGGGKTVVALYCIAKREQPSLIIVHTKELLYQWHKRSKEFLGLDDEQIGLIGDGHFTIGSHVTIAIVNSLYKRSYEVRDHIGFFIVDECHRTPSRTFIEAASAFDSQYMLGLSATPYRRDKLTQVINFYMGGQLINISPQELQVKSRIMKARVIVRRTEFDFDYAVDEDYQAMISALTQDTARVELIVADVLTHAKKDAGIGLVISDRKDHCKAIFNRIAHHDISVRLLTGDIPNRERKAITEELATGDIQILVATSQLIGEGFDLKQLSALF
ncbi:MAG: type III restriction protein res subunit [Candidatus Magnetoglobus multicellularis str. Araruama]|uniref:Type III restriction protein res subunit n=1 Tax=Candidatus Magnetoglobus multicellularis str. Araruama TaxID=890399 RepID=A0A1V1PFV2_9BACT|nr:MAG: type III restriction protein res subunit [Candidatus Magnetoglobus multicellularis str. Araruama]